MLALTACAREKNTDAAPECRMLWVTGAIIWPNGQAKKSETLSCSDGSFTVNSLTGDGESFRTNDPICLNCTPPLVP